MLAAIRHTTAGDATDPDHAVARHRIGTDDKHQHTGDVGIVAVPATGTRSTGRGGHRLG